MQNISQNVNHKLGEQIKEKKKWKQPNAVGGNVSWDTSTCMELQNFDNKIYMYVLCM